jgi:hypothetical protein
MNTIKMTLFLLTIVGLVSSCGNKSQDKKTTTKSTIYNEFKINHSLQGKTISISLKTDLPDDVKVTVSVSRSYWEKGNSSEYSVDYISEQSTIGEWKKEREILIDDEKWKSDLAKKQQELSLAGLGFDVDRISDSIEIYAVVPYTNDPYPNFKEKDLGKDEIKIHLPIVGAVAMDSKYANYQSLETGKTYSVSKKTPLMPEFEPSDAMAAIDKMKELVSGSRITILSIKEKNGTPWYEVNATDQKGNVIGKGWINSTALIGQEISVIN